MWTLSGFADEIDPDLKTQCATLNDLGITHIEFRSAWDTNVLDLTDEQLEEAAAILAAHDLAVSSIGSPLGKINIEDDFDAHLVRADRALTVAQRLGAPFIRIFSFFLRPDPETGSRAPEQHRDEVLRRMAALAERAAPTGIVLLHENEKDIYGDIPRRCLDIVESVGSEHLKVAWDAANFVQVGVRPYTEAYAMLRPHLAYVQIKDARLDTGEVVTSGEGDGELVETIRALRADGFDGFFSLEPHLGQAHALGGFSGPELFTEAWQVFTDILKAENIAYS
jgi:sugar phosphate isomerase/epimerase